MDRSFCMLTGFMSSTSCKLRPRRQVNLVFPLKSCRRHGEVTPIVLYELRPPLFPPNDKTAEKSETLTIKLTSSVLCLSFFPSVNFVLSISFH